MEIKPLTYKWLSALMCYPESDLLEALPELQAALSGSERSKAKVELRWVFKFWPNQICGFSPVANLKYIALRRRTKPV